MKLALLTIWIGLLFSPCFAQKTGSNCQDWQSRIDSKTTFYFKNDDDKTQEEIYKGIDCFFRLKGKKQSSNIIGATRSDVSQLFFEPTSLEVAALYYITYMVYQRWDYAAAPYLVDRKGRLNTSRSVNEAYKAYKIWFERVKEMGLEEARKRSPNPLANSSVRWY